MKFTKKSSVSDPAPLPRRRSPCSAFSRFSCSAHPRSVEHTVPCRRSHSFSRAASFLVSLAPRTCTSSNAHPLPPFAHKFIFRIRPKMLDIFPHLGYNNFRCGGVTQLARVIGSYPICHPFESDRRYQTKDHRWVVFLFGRNGTARTSAERPFGNEAKRSSRHPFRCRCNRKDAVSDRRYHRKKP